MPNTKHLIELEVLQLCTYWLLKNPGKSVDDFLNYHFDADNNKEL